MTNEKLNWKPLGVLKYVIGSILILVGIMGSLEALKNLIGFRGNTNVGFYILAHQLLWAIGNGILLLIGSLYLQQGRIILKPLHTIKDSSKIHTSNKRANLLIVLILLIALALLTMFYLSSKEHLEFINSY